MKKWEMSLFGDLASALKMWLISGFEV